MIPRASDVLSGKCKLSELFNGASTDKGHLRQDAAEWLLFVVLNGKTTSPPVGGVRRANVPAGPVLSAVFNCILKPNVSSYDVISGVAVCEVGHNIRVGNWCVLLTL